MIVVGGEALVDLVPGPGTREPGGPMLPRWGGGPYNVAVALGRLGTPTRFLSRISTDPFGGAMLERLRVSGVDTSLVQRGDEPSTLAVVGIEPSGSARYGFYTEGTADRLITDPGPLPADTEAVALGTLSMVLEPGASVYQKVLERESAAGRLISLDPNIRADLISDPTAYRARFRTWLPCVGLLKVSDEDAEWLELGGNTGHPKEWLDSGVGAIIVTQGGNGITAYTATGVVHVPSVRTVVVDTIGAGDTTHAALLARLYALGALTRQGIASLDQGGWQDVLSFAARAASFTCSRAGAEPPTAAELDSAEGSMTPNPALRH